MTLCGRVFGTGGNILPCYSVGDWRLALNPLQPHQASPDQRVSALETGILQASYGCDISRGAENPRPHSVLDHLLRDESNGSGIVPRSSNPRWSPTVEQHDAIGGGCIHPSVQFGKKKLVKAGRPCEVQELSFPIDESESLGASLLQPRSRAQQVS